MSLVVLIFPFAVCTPQVLANNSAADALSRLNLQEFRRLVPHANPLPHPIPPRYLPAWYRPIDLGMLHTVGPGLSAVHPSYVLRGSTGLFSVLLCVRLPLLPIVRMAVNVVCYVAHALSNFVSVVSISTIREL